MKNLWKFANRPLPKGVCQAMKGCDHCKIDWPYAIVMTAIIVVLISIPFG